MAAGVAVRYHGDMGKKKINPWPARLKDLRNRLQITQEQAGKRVRVTRRTWAGWEGGRVPSPAHQLLIELLEGGKI